MEDPVVLLAVLSAFLWILAIGGIVADYILPRIEPLDRFINSLPMMQQEEGFDGQ